jgi:hypothetical protein
MKLIRKADCLVLLAGVVLLLATRTGFACDCDLASAGKPFKRVVAEARNKSRAVFSGTVVAIDRKPGDLYVAVRFKIEEFWKGALSKEVTIFTGQGGGDCGYKFEVGQRYLVYAYKYNDRELGTNICQRTAGLIEAAEDLKVLGKGKLIGVRSQKSALGFS